MCEDDYFKAKFIAYISKTILYSSRQFFRKEQAIKNNEIELNEEIDVPSAKYDFEDGIFAFEEYKKMTKSLTERQEKILSLTYIGKSDSEIGNELGISPNTVRATRKQARDKIKKDMEDVK